MNKLVSIFYNLVLGIALGSSFALAAFVAPVIFNTDIALGQDILGRFQEGLIMTAVFKKYSILLNITVVVILLVEVIKFAVYKKRDYLQLGIALVVLVTSLLFTGYFAPAIIQAQTSGSGITQTESFQALHRASVLDFSFILVSLFVLMIKSFYTEAKT
ncbi:MAG: DUF4149 domain-containing protein [Desulfurivibrionaceae bacterium]